ncbi:MAG: ABC transporter substrate binding protein [Muricomes sp.]
MKHVLFISSYSESFETIEPQKKGIKEGFAGSNIQLDIEYMDTKRFDQKENEDLFYQHLRYKLRHTHKYDAILLGDDAALQFGQTYQYKLFPGIPMVFFCINNIEDAIKAGENPYITGAVEELYLKDTIDIAIRFQPDAQKIVAIYDNALSGQGDEKQFSSMKSKYPNYQFEGISSSKYTLQQFGEKLSHISEDSILIYMSRFQDADGNQYTIPESVQYIVSHTKVPVYRVSSPIGVSEGLIGGKMVSYEKSGRKAASMVLQILSGTSPADIPVVTKGESQYYFDYQVLKKHHIDAALIPPGSVVVNKGQTLFEKYRKIVIGIFLFVLITVSILFITSIDNLKRRRLTMELQTSHDKLQETHSKLVIAEEKLKQQYEANQEYTKYLETKEEFIRYQAEHDYLTELPNRRAAMEMLNTLITANEHCTVIIVDIDDFKEINDSYGHTCGDAVLKGISKRLLKLMHDFRFYASRLGGDEFLLIVRSVDTGPDSKLMFQIKKIFRAPIFFEEKEQYVKASMGVAYFRGDLTEASDIISNADFAMYTAKKSGKNECLYYNSGMKDEMINRKRIKNLLSEACQHDGFYVLYQPQVDAVTGAIASYEALLRLKNHSISPAQFISIAEETELDISFGPHRHKENSGTDGVVEKSWRRTAPCSNQLFKQADKG